MRALLYGSPETYKIRTVSLDITNEAIEQLAVPNISAPIPLSLGHIYLVEVAVNGAINAAALPDATWRVPFRLIDGAGSTVTHGMVYVDGATGAVRQVDDYASGLLTPASSTFTPRMMVGPFTPSAVDESKWASGVLCDLLLSDLGIFNCPDAVSVT